jgi:6-pyruvoyltetrahydropterin/6-carboxytetrahydropterin synthase
MTTINTRLAFEAAHRQYGDPSKCGYLHGHNWTVDVYVTSDTIGSLGYIVDFKDLKEITDTYDHKVLLHKDDPLAPLLADVGQKVKTLNLNPTCECLSVILCGQFGEVIPMFDDIVVVVHENEKSSASTKATYASIRGI